MDSAPPGLNLPVSFWSSRNMVQDSTSPQHRSHGSRSIPRGKHGVLYLTAALQSGAQQRLLLHPAVCAGYMNRGFLCRIPHRRVGWHRLGCGKGIRQDESSRATFERRLLRLISVAVGVPGGSEPSSGSLLSGRLFVGGNPWLQSHTSQVPERAMPCFPGYLH